MILPALDIEFLAELSRKIWIGLFAMFLADSQLRATPSFMSSRERAHRPAYCLMPSTNKQLSVHIMALWLDERHTSLHAHYRYEG